MAQWALPDANLSTTNWIEGVGDGDGDWYEELDEGFGAGRGTGSGPDDNTSAWQSPVNPIQELINTAMSTVIDPVSSVGHIYRTRNRKTAAGGRTIDIAIAIRENGVDIASALFTNVDNIYATRTITLTGGEADSITDYSAIEGRTGADVSSWGSSRKGVESAHEFEVPDVPSGGYLERNYPRGVNRGILRGAIH